MSNVRPFPAADEDEGEYIDRRVPADAAAEQAVLSACMYDPANVERVNFLSRADFYLPGHQLVWDVLQQQARTGQPTSPIALHSEIERLGQLRMVAGGAYLFTISQAPSVSAEYYAEIVHTKARARRTDELLIRLKVAIHEGVHPDQLDQQLADHYQAEQQRAAAVTGTGPAHLMGSVLNWTSLFDTDFGGVQLLPGRLMAPGQQIALVGDGKAGKSLFMQEWAWRMATGQSFLDDKPQDPVRITYVDAENGHPQIQQRFISFGADPRQMGTLTYVSFPPIRPLDTAGGGQDLMALARATEAELLVIDTVSRFISGVENDADTWLNLYRHTLMPLKAAGIASVRLDHFGKDKDRGARGNSAKTQDVDHVWELTAQGGGILALKRSHTRTGIGPDQFTLIRHARKNGDHWVPGATKHEVMHGEDVASRLEGSPEWVIAQLDKASVPAEWGSPRIIKWCAEQGIKAAKSKIEEAVRIRKNRASRDLPGDLPYSPVTEPPRQLRGGEHKTPGQTSPGEVLGTPGDVPTAPPSPRPLSKEGGGECAPGTTAGTHTPPCTFCGKPLDPEWDTDGRDQHPVCDIDE